MLNEVPAVLVVDADMPRMDGIELTRKIRANARLAEMPVILLSLNLSEDRQALARDIGVDHFLGKPCKGDELLRHVAGFIAAVRSSE
jgi:chemosensory pili system protein ChpA (sensor histidine kinase/response regulator)